MFHELTVGGVLVSPFVAYAALALAILLALRPFLRMLRFERAFANPPLAEAGIYVCILALLIVMV
ncbi:MULTISPECIES: DUF1656 domain-containing protein [Methylobacterium]|jgi:hypothetical protein|uniref:Membrane protein n=2 Tax=Methylobacterium TaxID=407 RepID=A0A0C6FJL6_9HYPH|nr:MULTISPECIES: DUF1656 domain-containing protein [Methylobacterium]MBK3399412.1 DUF1656 domain-containing protein [Methylobacterium ajmalii]MBK3406955.1 DUF1656 domain-containing protein [Methylobacterium ajmalii]MBK3425335.1 DUF1656 domain-containing protein [Methylobacterium ajmalii]MBZ6411334.1 DUF1656 domain-containing protein [Methylobacterium sp.]SFE53979.1 Protein of unknown function [Methylobacterium sp. yr596]